MQKRQETLSDVRSGNKLEEVKGICMEAIFMRKSELVLVAIALAMGVASVVLGILKTAPETIVILLGIGLFAISLARFQKSKN